MKRRRFFGLSLKGALASQALTLFGSSRAGAQDAGVADTEAVARRARGDEGQWLQLGTGPRPHPDRRETRAYDVAVIGGGAAGMCAAVAAARNGARTVLVQDRPVLGGNSSSEIRVHLNGVNKLKGGLAERETGIIEEILLHNRFNNPQESFTVWDHVLYDFIDQEPDLELMLNTSAMRAEMDGNKIVAATCYQLTTETTFTIKADVFIDCSGDGTLAATAGALYRTGREAAAEFNEKYAPPEADGWQMGATLLLSSKDTGRPMPFNPPSFTRPYRAGESHKGRKLIPFVEGFWWVEVGSKDDIIGEYEDNRHKLMGYAYGAWDYIKNSGHFPEADNYALDWVCSLPGKRESRRFIGDYILCEPDMLGNKQFPDAVAYGGWSLDEHNPGGIENLSEPPSYFHEHFSEVYQIPYRSLYSVNILNLLFAGRNISQTHIALSSSRIMATCALEGQAAGTAAAICHKKGITPRAVGREHISELQEQLLRDDAFIPGRPAADPLDLARSAARLLASSTRSGAVELLTDGTSRDFNGVQHHWESDGLPATVRLEWVEPITLARVVLKGDTNVKRNLMMRKDSRNDELYGNSIPRELVRKLTLEARVAGKWVTLQTLEENQRRLIKLSEFEPVRTTSVRVRVDATYGYPNARLFEIRTYTS